MHGARRNSFGHLRRTNDCTPVIEDLDKIILFDTPCFSILEIHPHDPVVIIIDQYSVVLDIVDPAMLTIPHGMKAVSWMRGDQLQWILLIKVRGMMALPRRDVFGHHRSLRVVRVKPL